MEWPFDESGTYRDARIEFADFTGTTIRESRLNGVRFMGVEMGIDTAASPTFEEAVRIWRERSAALAAYLAAATADDLARFCEPNDGPRWPPIAPGTTAVRCLRVVFDETWAHHRFAVRDLALIESPAPAANTGR